MNTLQGCEGEMYKYKYIEDNHSVIEEEVQSMNEGVRVVLLRGTQDEKNYIWNTLKTLFFISPPEMVGFSRLLHGC